MPSTGSLTRGSPGTTTIGATAVGSNPGLVRTALRAGLLSGFPSTTWAVVWRHDPLAATRAAGTLVPGRRHRPGLVAGTLVHAGLSLGWTAVLLAVLRPRGSGVAGGAAAGLAVAALDLGVVGRRWPAIRELPQLPQWADHVVFGAIVGTAAAARPHPRREQRARTDR